MPQRRGPTTTKCIECGRPRDWKDQRRVCHRCRHARRRGGPATVIQSDVCLGCGVARTWERATNYCPSCEWQRTKERDPDASRRQTLMNRYGLTIEGYDAILEAQGGRCALCGRAASEFKRRLSVDHDHESGRIRGLLCYRCNNGLAAMGDSVAGLERAIKYLRGER